MIVNHVGLRVADVDRSIRFYAALGFTVAEDMELPDEAVQQLVQVDPPIGLRAVYLVSGPFVLELIGMDTDHHPAPSIERGLSDTGLTHLSLGVDDVEAAKAAIAANGGEILADSDVRVAVLARDPDGQLLELLRSDLRPVTPPDVS